MTMWLLMSCSEIKKDAQTIADLKCLAIDAHGDKKERYEQQIDIISIKYSGSDLVELEKTADELFKKCPAKIKEDKEKYNRREVDQNGPDIIIFRVVVAEIT